MLELKLILKNFKKQLRVYFVYFLGIVIVISLLIMYANFMTIAMRTFTDLSKVKIVAMRFSLKVIAILIFLFLLFINIYGNKMMRKVKAKEYGIYRLYGITNLNLFKLIYMEQMFILLVSFVASIFIGWILTFGILFIANMSIKEYIPEGFSLHLSISSLVYIFILLVIIGAVTSLINYRKVSKQQILKLLNEEADLKPSKKLSTFEFFFYLINIIITYALIMYIMQNQLVTINFDEILVIIFMWCIGIYFLYKVLSYSFIKLIPKKVLYSKENIFTMSQVTRRLSTNLKSMSFITIFLVFLFSLIFLGSTILQYTTLRYQQEDIIIKGQEEFGLTTISYKGKDYSYKFTNTSTNLSSTDGLWYEFVPQASVNEFLKSNNFKTISLKDDEVILINSDSAANTLTVNKEGEEVEQIDLKVKANVDLDISGSYGYQYAIVSDEYYEVSIEEKYEEEINKLVEQNKDISDIFKFQTLGSYSSNYGVIGDKENEAYFPIIKESEINKYFEFEGIDYNFDLNYGEFGLLGTMIEYRKSYEDSTEVVKYESSEDGENGKDVQVGKIVDKKKMYISNIGDYDSTYLIISDEQSKDITNPSTEEYTYINYTSDKKKQDEEWLNLENKEEYRYVDRPEVGIKVKKSQELYTTNLLILSFTVYISFIILVLLICILSLHSAIDSVESKKEFEKLKRINYSNNDLKKSVNKITVIYFIVPFVVAALNLYIYSKPFLTFLKNSNQFAFFQFMEYKTTVIVMLIVIVLYILFFILINYSYKKIIEV